MAKTDLHEVAKPVSKRHLVPRDVSIRNVIIVLSDGTSYCMNPLTQRVQYNGLTKSEDGTFEQFERALNKELHARKLSDLCS